MTRKYRTASGKVATITRHEGSHGFYHDHYVTVEFDGTHVFGDFCEACEWLASTGEGWIRERN